MWNPATQTLSRTELDARHLRRLQRLVAYVYDNVGMYRRLYDKHGFAPRDLTSLEIYQERLPATDKAVLLADQRPGAYAGTAPGTAPPAYHYQTTGTTGAPLLESYTNYDALRLADQWCYALWDGGVRPGDGVFVCFTWGPWVGFWSLYWACQRLNLTIFSGGGMSTTERARAISATRPAAVAATPSYLVNLAESAREEGIDLADAGIRFVLGGGEAGLNVGPTRRMVREYYGVPDSGVLDFYGIGEVAQEYGQCARKAGGVHVMEDACYSYAADPDTGSKVADGEIGENIVTNFTRIGQLFVKYRTRDLVRLHEDHDHGCGWTWAFLDGAVLGRTDYVVQVRGVNIYPTAVEEIIGRVPGLSKHHEVHVHKSPSGSQMRVRVEALADLEAPAHAERSEALAQEYRKAFGVRLDVEVVPARSLPRQEIKSQRFFEHEADAGPGSGS